MTGLSLAATPLYAGLLTMLMFWLSLRVVLQRRAAKVSVGDGGNRLMIKRMRAQSNFVEYAPLGILLLLLVELQGAPLWVCHILGAALLGGRVLHAVGFGSDPQIIPMRKSGMYLTLASLIGAAVLNIGFAIF